MRNLYFSLLPLFFFDRTKCTPSSTKIDLHMSLVDTFIMDMLCCNIYHLFFLFCFSTCSMKIICLSFFLNDFHLFITSGIFFCFPLNYDSSFGSYFFVSLILICVYNFVLCGRIPFGIKVFFVDLFHLICVIMLLIIFSLLAISIYSQYMKREKKNMCKRAHTTKVK